MLRIYHQISDPGRFLRREKAFVIVHKFEEENFFLHKRILERFEYTLSLSLCIALRIRREILDP
jgi:hypothetical protein